MKLGVKKVLLPNLPYVFLFWFFDKVAQGYRLAEGADMITRAMGALSGLGSVIVGNPLPSFHLQDLMVGADRHCRGADPPAGGLHEGEEREKIPARR